MTADLMSRVVSDVSGIVRRVSELYVPNGHPRLVNVVAEPTDFAGLVGAAVEPRAGASHYDRRSARAAAIGETIERYCASWVPAEQVTLGRAANIPDAIAPERLRAFTDAQTAAPGAFANLDEHSLVGWVRGTTLADGSAASAPAQMVYLGYHLADGEERLGPFTSTGLACATSAEDAIVRGLLESIERDALMLTWRLRLSSL